MINLFELCSLVRMNAANGDEIVANFLISLCGCGLKEYHSLGEAKIEMSLLYHRIEEFVNAIDEH
jgi:hypothetical protein